MARRYLKWHIVPRRAGRKTGAGSRAALPAAALPSGVLTFAPPLCHENMPAEVSLLLPVNHGPANLIRQVIAEPAHLENRALGLFLANPFLDIEREGARLARAGVRWIANLPSVEQQDREFSRQLTDAGLGQARELECLARFREQGFRIAAVVTDGPGAAAALAVTPQALIVLPRIADFAAGFPSLRQRGAAVQAVADAVREAGWSGAVLGLGSAREAESEELWPRQWDGLIHR